MYRQPKSTWLLLLAGIFFLPDLMPANSATSDLPLIDAHIHYSRDAWDRTSAEEAIAILRKAGLKKALVSSSSDEGTQRLYTLAPDLVVPVLRPYRRRGELASWLKDESVVGMLAERLENYRYAGIGEFHAYGESIEFPVMQAVIRLSKQYGIFLHAHSDREAIERIYNHDADAMVLWAHAGFEPISEIRATMEKYPNLWADLSFRDDFFFYGEIDPEWRQLFLDFADRFVLGTDTYTPDRWYLVNEYAGESRDWLKLLPVEVAKNIAYRNAERLLDAVDWE